MRSRLLMTVEDLQHERQREIEAEFAGACCGEIEARWQVTRYWNGWRVECECGELIAELDGE